MYDQTRGGPSSGYLTGLQKVKLAGCSAGSIYGQYIYVLAGITLDLGLQQGSIWDTPAITLAFIPLPRVFVYFSSPWTLLSRSNGSVLCPIG